MDAVRYNTYARTSVSALFHPRWLPVCTARVTGNLTHSFVLRQFNKDRSYRGSALPPAMKYRSLQLLKRRPAETLPLRYLLKVSSTGSIKTVHAFIYKNPPSPASVNANTFHMHVTCGTHVLTVDEMFDYAVRRTRDFKHWAWDRITG